MFAVILDLNNTGLQVDESLAGLLSSYGVDDIAHLNDEASLVPVIESHDSHSEVVLVGKHPQISNLVIRRLTLRSVRLPSCLVVWDGPAQGRLVAARVPLASLRQSMLEKSASLENTLRALEGVDGVTSYTIQQFASIDAFRIGGSFSKSGIRQYFIKNCSGRGTIKLLDEIGFYQTLPPSLGKHYPKLLFAEQDEQSVSMGTEYKEYPNLRDLLLNRQIEPAEAVRLLRQVLDYEYNLALRPNQQPTPANYLHNYHYHRVWRRIGMSIELDPAFVGLVGARRLKVNGQLLPNIPAMLLRLEEDEKAAARLDPGGVSPFIHADLHLGNILYDRNAEHFWLVDPRGYPLCDIFYDLGKLSHSYNGKYDLLHEGRHTASCVLHNDIAVIDFHFANSILTDIYTELGRRMQPVIQELLGAHEDSNDVDLRVRFNEAMHFCSVMPFHMHPDQDPSIAIPMYAIGAQLLAKVLRLLDVDVDACTDQQSAGLERLAFMSGVPWRFED
ncbi:hypothetical protein DL769_009908 [Monosporascus sp. CRB-8-3]|nr:hypothetical protein DL769_009908 [Monosporascus sp. CRB-8-3]